MDYSYLTSLSGNTDPTKLETAYQNLLGSQGYAIGNPQSRPAGWFIAAGDDKNFKAPYVPPPSSGGGKWICTEMVRRGVISRDQFKKLRRAHAISILIRPNFCFWYLKHGKDLCDQMNRAGFSWRDEGSKFYETLEKIYQRDGLKNALSFYRLFCTVMWARYARAIMPSPDREHFGLIKFLKEKWFWKNLFEGAL